MLDRNELRGRARRLGGRSHPPGCSPGCARIRCTRRSTSLWPPPTCTRRPPRKWASAARREGRYNPHTLGEMARKRHAHMTGMTGAATGVGGLVTMVPDLVALAWLQSRMVFYIAGAFGWDPFDPMRPAELLALTDLYTDPAGARASSGRAGRQVGGRALGRHQAPARRGDVDEAVRDGRQEGRPVDRRADDPGVRDRLQRGLQPARHEQARPAGDRVLRRSGLALTPAPPHR